MVQFGAGTYCAEPLRVLFEQSNVIIGKFCSISNGVTMMAGGEHNSDYISTYPFNFMDWGYAPDAFAHPKTKGDIIIDNDVWIGMGAMILSGVHIGSGAVIGANSVVAKDVDDYSIVGGNPASHIRYRFGEAVRKELLRICWWDWTKEEIQRAVPFLMNNNIIEFLNYCKTREAA